MNKKGDALHFVYYLILTFFVLWFVWFFINFFVDKNNCEAMEAICTAARGNYCYTWVTNGTQPTVPVLNSCKMDSTKKEVSKCIIPTDLQECKDLMGYK